MLEKFTLVPVGARRSVKPFILFVLKSRCKAVNQKATKYTSDVHKAGVFLLENQIIVDYDYHVSVTFPAQRHNT